MPVYEYVCTACSEPLEVRQSFTEDAMTVCPACEGRLRKVLSPVGVVFKGSGFYRTDSRASAGGEHDGASASDGKSAESGKESGKSGKSAESGQTSKEGSSSSDSASKTGTKTSGSDSTSSSSSSEKATAAS